MPDLIQTDAGFLASLKTVANNDIHALAKARINYGESWCKRGGVGAFMMLARKWDRLENFLSNPPPFDNPPMDGPAFDKYDILEACRIDGRPEGTIDDIRDLRRYLLLVEAKLVETGFGAAEVAKDVDDQPTASQLHPE